MEKNRLTSYRAVAGTVFVLLCCMPIGEAVRCWDCNSKFDPRCADGAFDKNALATRDCDSLDLPHINATARYCRKVVQFIEFTERTVRSCGWLDDTKARESATGCYKRTGTKDILVFFCQCEGDACNLAPWPTPSAPTLLLAALAAALLRF